VRDVLSFFRPEGTTCDPFFPFTEASVNEILKMMQQNKLELKPRAIMQFFTAVLEQADQRIEGGELKTISAGFVQGTLILLR
jgi:hypothetical protein